MGSRFYVCQNPIDRKIVDNRDKWTVDDAAFAIRKYVTLQFICFLPMSSVKHYYVLYNVYVEMLPKNYVADINYHISLDEHHVTFAEQ